MKENDLQARFKQDGVVIIPDFFKADELAEMNAVIDTLLKIPKAASKCSDFYVKNYQTEVDGLGVKASEHPAFTSFQSHPRMKEATVAALGGEFIDEYLLVQVTRQGTGQAWHQDSSDPVNFVLNRLIYTRDIAPENGQIVVVPGSIHRGRIPSGGHQDSIPGEVALAPKAGTLVLMSTYCWHRVTLNTTATPRVSVNYRVRPKSAPEGLTALPNFRNGTYDFRTRTPVGNA
jgi:hypothetical protein